MRASVCVVTTVHPPFDPRVFERCAVSLARAGYEVTLVAPHDRAEERDGVRIIAIRRSRSRFVRAFRGGWQAFRLAGRTRADLYHFHDPEFMPFALLLRWITRKPVIYDVHEDYPQHMLTKFRLPTILRCAVSWGMSVMERVCARRLPCVITATPALTERFVQMGARRAETILNLPSSGFLDGTADDRLPAPVDVIHVGSLSAARLAFLLAVASEVGRRRAQTGWRIVGFDDRFLGRAREMVREGGLVESVELVGKVSHEEVGRHLRVAKVGVNHHPAERRFQVAIPVKVLEYMAAGLPVISSEMPLLRELAGDEAIVYVDPGDRAAFVGAVLDVLSDPELSARLGKAARRLSRERLNWAREEPKLLRIYKDLLS